MSANSERQSTGGDNEQTEEIESQIVSSAQNGGELNLDEGNNQVKQEENVAEGEEDMEQVRLGFINKFSF